MNRALRRLSLRRFANGDRPRRGRVAGPALRASIDGEVRFDNGTRVSTRPTARTTARRRSASSSRGTSRTSRRPSASRREHGAPILSRGGGTSLAGQCCNVAVVMDFSKYMHHVLRIDADARLGHAEPGCVLDRFRETAKDQAGLYFGPDPATHSRCTIGGMLGNNSCGSHSLLSKNHGLGVRMSDNTHALDVLLYDGTRMHVGPTPPDELDAIIRGGGRRGEVYAALKALVDRYGNTIREKFPRLERRVSGYNLNDLLPENGFNVARALVGSESTLVTILEATLHLVPAAKARTVVMLGFADIYAAAECALEVLKFKPIACEGIDHLLFDYVKQKGDENASLAILPKGPAFLLIEFGGESKEDSDDQARRMMDHVKGSATHAAGRHEALRRPRAGRDDLEGPRRRPREHRVGAGPARHVARLGRLGRAGRRGAAIPPRAPRPVPQVWLQPLALRPHGPGVHPLPRPVRSLHREGNRKLPALHGRGGRARREVRRRRLGRTRRRPGTRRIPPEDVRPRAVGGVHRVQADLGSRRTV